MPVLYGVFLYMGVSSLKGIQVMYNLAFTVYMSKTKFARCLFTLTFEQIRYYICSYYINSSHSNKKY